MLDRVRFHVLGSFALVAAVLTAGSLVGCAANAGDGEEESQVDTTEDALRSCSGLGCDGIMPGNSRCVDGHQETKCSAAIRNSAGKILGHVDLMYSPDCQSSWAKVTSAI